MVPPIAGGPTGRNCQAQRRSLAVSFNLMTCAHCNRFRLLSGAAAKASLRSGRGGESAALVQVLRLEGAARPLRRICCCWSRSRRSRLAEDLRMGSELLFAREPLIQSLI
jgi:hypothetical protein